MSKTITVWLIEREFIFPPRFVPVAVAPSATKEAAELERDALPNPSLYTVTEYQRVEKGAGRRKVRR